MEKTEGCQGMLNNVLSYCQVLVALAVVVTIVLVASGRNDRFLRVFMASFAMHALSFLVNLIAGKADPAAVSFAASLFFVLSQFLLAWGIRQIDGHPRSWPFRFSLYLASFSIFGLACMLLPSLSAALPFVATVYTMTACAEQSGAIWRGFDWLPSRVRGASLGITGLIFLFHLGRLTLLVLDAGFSVGAAGETTATTVMQSAAIVFIVLRLACLFILDSARLSRDMELKNVQLEQLAMKDALTGLFNRNSLDKTIHAEMGRQDRYGDPLSLIMIDIDHFKQVNDTYGHDNGDLVLADIARRVNGSLRQEDILFRWGGEEFLILLPHTDGMGATALASKIRLTVADSPIQPVGQVTVSLGVAERLQNESKDDWFHRVDKMLYRAKQGGRNRVECWPGEQGRPAPAVYLEWQKNWESGSDIIDRQHRQMVRMGNELINQSLAGVPYDTLQDSLDSFIDHIRLHFADENRIITAAGYPEAHGHAKIHETLLAEAHAIRNDNLGSSLDPSLLFHLLVNRIVIEHMLSEDVKFFPWLNKPGMTVKTRA